MKKTVLCALLFIISAAHAQQFQWATQFGGKTYDIATDQQNNVYSTGSFHGNPHFDPGPMNHSLTSNGGVDGFIFKQDAYGSRVWAHNIGGISGDEGRALTVDAQANVYVTGIYGDTVDFDPGPDTIMRSNLHMATWLMKLNTNGDVIWANAVQNSGWNSANVILLHKNIIYVAGTFKDTVDFDMGPDTTHLYSVGQSAFIASYDNGGNFLWAKNLGATEATALEADSTGFIYVSVSVASDSAQVMKMLPTGQVIWTAAVTADNVILYDIEVDAGGSVFGTGAFTGQGDLDPGTGQFPISAVFPGYDIFVFRWSTAGTFIWGKTIANENANYGNEIEIDGLGHVFVGGSFDGPLDFDPSYNSDTLYGDNLFLLKLSMNGDHLWAGEYGHSSQYIHGMHISADNDVYLGGHNYENFDAIPGPGQYLMPGGAHIIKLSQEITAVAGQSVPAKLKVFPNPGNGQIRIDAGEPVSNVTVAGIDGKVIKTFTAGQSDLDLGLQPGVYILRISTSTGLATARIVIQ